MSSLELDPRRAAAALDAVGEAVFDVDIALRRITWSRGITLVFGHDPARIGDRLEDWQRLVHPDDLGAATESGRSRLRGSDAVWSHELRLARADGTFVPVRVRAFLVPAGARGHVVGAVADLAGIRGLEEETRRLAAELADGLGRERAERTRAGVLMRCATDEAIGEWDIRTGTISWSPNVSHVLGYPAEELGTIDQAVTHAVGDEGRRTVDEVLLRFAQGASEWSGNVHWLLPSSRPIALGVRAYVLRGSSNEPVAVIGSLRHVAASQAVTTSVSRGVSLTARQREVLRLVRLGLTNKEIGVRLGVSEHAAKVQVSKLLRKFRAGSRAVLAVIAREAELGG